MRNQGFTLIEVAIAILILGLFIAPLSLAYTNFVKRQKIYTHYSKFSEIKENINFFVAREGRYPLPASLSVGSGDVGYGLETPGTILPCSSWPTANGVCRTPGVDPILIGGVPFKALGIHEDESADYWGRKILYAVTEAQTISYMPGNGKIVTQALDASSATVQISNNIDMVFVSFGQNGKGAYTREGNVLDSCSIGTLESENCNLDNTFLLRENETVFPVIGTAGFVIGANYYDDFVEQQQNVPVDLWLQNLTDTDYALTYASRIGVGTNDPQNKVHVLGDARADNVLSNSICPGGGTNCFDPLMIAGAKPEMNCSLPIGASPILRLQNSRVYCGSATNTSGNPISGDAFAFPTDFTRTDCAVSGQLMTGINASGDPICANP